VASIFENFESGEHTTRTTAVQLVRAREWFADNLSDGDIVFMKLTCEGAEVDIVEDLLDGDELRTIYNVMITFDVRKSKSLQRRERALREGCSRGV
jgi:hypothetical protein